MNDFFRHLNSISGLALQTSVPMREKTSFRIGGEAKFYAEAADPSAFTSALNLCVSEGIPCYLVGGGTNLLVSDRGISGLVLRLKTSRGESVEISGDEVRISMDASQPLSSLISIARNSGAVGYAHLAGIPGTIGGAVAMNAGTRFGDIGASISSVQLISADGTAEFSQEALNFSYRSASIPAGCAVLRASFKFRRGQRAASEAEANLFCESLQRRKISQPHEPSAGCAFKNPERNAAGALIDQCGLKGRSAGNARISPKHANFIVNEGGASSADVLFLMRTAQAAVKERFHIDLTPEIKFLGDFEAESLPNFSRFIPDLASKKASSETARQL